MIRKEIILNEIAHFHDLEPVLAIGPLLSMYGMLAALGEDVNPAIIALSRKIPDALISCEKASEAECFYILSIIVKCPPSTYVQSQILIRKLIQNTSSALISKILQSIMINLDASQADGVR